MPAKLRNIVVLNNRQLSTAGKFVPAFELPDASQTQSTQKRDSEFNAPLNNALVQKATGVSNLGSDELGSLPVDLSKSL